MRLTNVARHLIKALDALIQNWDLMLQLYERIEDENEDFPDLFARAYPFERSFDEYPQVLRTWRNNLEAACEKDVHVKIEQNYCPDADITYLMEVRYENGCWKSKRCVGWFDGKPSEDPEEIERYRQAGSERKQVYTGTIGF